jgi:hypothetical protein
VNTSLQLFHDIAHETVWCSLATVDRRSRPHTRLVHPVWQVSDDGTSLTGWVTTRPTPIKRAHLAHSPFVSCSYWSPATHDVAVADCFARWGDDAERRHVWQFVQAFDAPLGFDPGPIFGGSPDSPEYAVLRLRPTRTRSARATTLAAGSPHQVWSA